MIIFGTFDMKINAKYILFVFLSIYIFFSAFLFLIKGPHITNLIWVIGSLFVATVLTVCYFSLRWVLMSQQRKDDESE